MHQQEKLNLSLCFNRFQTDKKKRDDNIKQLRE